MFIFALFKGLTVFFYIQDEENMNCKSITLQLKEEIKIFYPELQDNSNEFNQILRVSKQGFVFGIKILIDDPTLIEAYDMEEYSKAIKH